MDGLTEPQRAALECLADGEWHECWKRVTDPRSHKGRVNTRAVSTLCSMRLARYMPDRSPFLAGRAQITEAGRDLLARSRRWDPDYVVSPGSILAEWLTDMGLTSTLAMATIFHREHVDDAAARIDEIIAGAPLSLPVAEWLAAVPGCPSKAFWMALEHNYRVGLAAGKRKVS